MGQTKIQNSPRGEDMGDDLAQALRDRRKDGQVVYLMVDASKSPETRATIEALSDDALCMFDGQGFDDLAEVAPWLVPLPLDDEDDVFEWFMSAGYGKNWGLFLIAGPDAHALKMSLKPALWLKGENDEDLFFKFYRPSGFNNYVPGFEPEYAAHMLRDVAQVWAENGEDPTVVHRYAIRDGALGQADLRLVFDPPTPTPEMPEDIEEI